MTDTEKFIAKAILIHGKYDYSKTVVVHYHEKVIITCKEHGDFLIRPDAHLYQKQGCKICAYANRKITNKITTEQFIKNCKNNERNKNNDYTMTVYDGRLKPITFKCGICERIVIQQAKQHEKNGCNFCSGRGINKYDNNTFTTKAKEVHGSTYDYSKVNLNSANDYITIICRIHGEFIQKAINHINSNGCPQCMGGIKINTNEYIKRAKLKHGDEFNYCKTEYIKAHKEVTIVCSKHGEFKQLAYVHLQTKISCPFCVAELTSSFAEKEIVSFLKQHYTGLIIQNDRQTFDCKEIDILIPELNLGIEFNGNYWHTETIVGKGYHSHKANLADEKGIKLIQIFEHEWNNKQEIVKSRLQSTFGVNKKIYARHTNIVALNTQDKNNFLEQTHIQGKDNSSIYFGLTFDSVLVACMTFGKPRFNSCYDYELIRYSSALNTNIIGGAGKLLKEFKKNFSGSVISYCDRRWSTGEMYKHLGFQMNGKTSPGYFYYHINNKTIHNRLSFQKHLLKAMPFYDKDLSEYDIMKLNGYDRIWNAGMLRFGLKSKEGKIDLDAS